jgi:hypothetical protein
MHLVSTFRELLLELTPIMTTPTFQSFLILVAGWLFARKRTVTGMIQAAGALGRKHHSAFHRVFAAARWSLDEFGLLVFGIARHLLGPGQTIFLALDDTLARKRGLKVFGVGMHHDPLLSSRSKAIVNWGHSWVVLGVLVQLPLLKGRWFCLPILFRLYRSKQTIAASGGTYRSRPELAVQMLQLVCKAFPKQHLHVLADSAYSGKSVVKHLPENCDLTGRMHMQAALYEILDPQTRAGRGRPRKRGQRRPCPEKMLEGNGTQIELNVYGRHEKAKVGTCRALWYATAGSRPLRVVAVEPLTGGRKRQAFYSTCADASALDVLGWCARRWSLEVAFHDAKGYLGFEEPQGWTRRAVLRTAPTAMLLYSLIVLWFSRAGHRHLSLPDRPWYRHKSQPSFADMLTTLRRECLRETFLQSPAWDERSTKMLRSLIELCCRAA